jgi:hypothetical protein
MVVKTAKRSVYSSSHKGRRNGLALSFDADRGGGKRRALLPKFLDRSQM